MEDNEENKAPENVDLDVGKVELEEKEKEPGDEDPVIPDVKIIEIEPVKDLDEKEEDDDDSKDDKSKVEEDEEDSGGNKAEIKKAKIFKVVLNDIVCAIEDDELISSAFGTTRIYESVVMSKIKRSGKTDVTNIPVQHQIANSSHPMSPLAAVTRRDGEEISTGFMVTKDALEWVIARVNRANNPLSILTLGRDADYGRILEVMASALARYVNTGRLTWSHVTGGNNSIFNRESIQGRTFTPENSISIPYPDGTQEATSAWIGIVAGALGSGVYVLTNSAPVDSTGSVSIVVPKTETMVESLISGISELLSSMTEAECGSLAMYSIARGWHSENKVISVTDEGDWLRKVYTHGVSSCPPCTLR